MAITETTVEVQRTRIETQSGKDLLKSQIRRARERAAELREGACSLEKSADEWEIRMGLPCPSWCDLPEGHASLDHPDDRVHVSSESSLSVNHEIAGAYLYQHVTETQPTIRLENMHGRELVMTVSEARQAAEALLALCKEAS